MLLTERRLAVELAKMTRIIKINKEKDYLSAAQEAKNVLENGGIVALPTDTIYGISTRLKSVDSIYQLKQRSLDKPLGIFVGNIGQIYQYANVEVEKGLLEALLPGPVTLIFDRKPSLPSFFNPDVDKVGFRIPDSKFVQLLMNLVDEPIAQTSANVSGSPLSPICIEDFQNLWPNVDLIVDGGPILQHQRNRDGSTIVDLSNPGKFSLVRLGCASFETVQTLKKFGLLESTENQKVLSK